MNKRKAIKVFLGILALAVSSSVLVGCNKKDDPKVTNAGGGVSSQSVVTLKGAAS